MNLSVNSELNNFISDIKQNVVIQSDYDIPVYNTKNIFSNKKILILSGGGVRGICHIGALQALEDTECLNNIEIFVGTSIGAILCVLTVCGYKPKELFVFLKTIDLDKLKCIKLENLLMSYGLDLGNNLDYIIEKLITKKNFNPNITFAELYEKTKKKLILTTVCVNDTKITYLSHESTPNLSVKLALRMSSCVPILFSPILYNNKYYIDGGCIDNYPIHLFDDRLNEVIGIYLKGVVNTDCKISNIEEYLIQTIKCLMESGNFHTIKGYEKQTVVILISQPVFNFAIDDEQKNILFKLGFDSVMEFNK